MSSSNIIQITLPSSKSLSNRWLVMDYLSASGVKIKNLSTADDSQLLKRLLRQLKMGRRHTFDCHDAGSVARFLTGLLAFTPGQHVLTGTPRLCERPMAPLIEALRSVGCQITCMQTEGFLPLKIEGVQPSTDRIRVDGTQSSQFVSALLMGALLLPKGLAVEVTGAATSEPYIDMTLRVLSTARVEWALKGTPPAYFIPHTLPHLDSVTIEKDWSASSYFYSAVALQPELNLRMSGLYRNSSQGDCRVSDIFAHLGVSTMQGELCVEVSGTGTRDEMFEYDFAPTPDLFPATAVTCAAMGIEARLNGIGNLRLKESDRVAAVVEELQKMGCTIEQTGEQVHILPSTLNVTQPVDPHNDHRIAMAFAILRLKYPQLEVLNPDVVSKSFPLFWEMLDRVLQGA